MSEATPRPWEFKDRNWRGERDKHNFYIVGDRRECVDIDDEPNEDGEYSSAVTSVAIVVGNETAGDIPRANAELICRAVNCHEELLAACEEVLLFCEPDGTPRDGFRFREAIAHLRAAISKAKGVTT